MSDQTDDFAHKKNWNFFGTLSCNLLSIYSPGLKHSHPNDSILFISHVYVQFRVQDHLALKLMHRTRTTSDFDVLNMHGKLRR
jgi:hypothetical protein